MFTCLDCLRTFEEPKSFTETHGLESPLYETWSGCPACSGTYANAIECSQCNEYIKSDYIKLEDGYYVCEECFSHRSLGDD